MLKIHSRLVSLFFYELQSKEIQVQIEEQTSVPFWAMTDWAVYEQALFHILQNAVRYSGGFGQIKLSTSFVDMRRATQVRNSQVSVVQLARVGGDEVDWGYLITQVSDTGGGISAHEFNKIKFTFHRLAGEANAEAKDGAGSGLPVAASLAVLLGGALSVSTKPFDGTTVTLIAQVRSREVVHSLQSLSVSTLKLREELGHGNLVI